MYDHVRPLLFALDAETAHRFTLYALGVAPRSNLRRFRFQGEQQRAQAFVHAASFPLRRITSVS